MLERYRKTLRWDLEVTLEGVNKYCRKYLGRDLSEIPELEIAQNVSPWGRGYPLNEVASASSLYRDVTIARRIGELWSQGRPMFVVYGYGHAYRLEPFINALS